MRHRDSLPAIVLILLLATFLRFHLLGAQSFWNDEGNSARLSERSISLIIEGTASDVHPPLYYLALHGWRELVGETEFGLRALSAFAGILTVAMAMALGRQGNKGATIGRLSPLIVAIAGLLAAVNPALVYYSQEARMYALLALLAAGATWALLNWLGAGRRRSWPVTYVMLLTAGLYTHYFFPAVVAVHGLIMALHWLRERARGGRTGRQLLTWAAIAAIAVALYSPWVPVLLRQVGGRAGGGGTGAVEFLTEAGRWLAVGSTMPSGEASWAMWAMAALVVLGMVVGRWRAVVPALMVAVPLGAAVALGATDPAFFKFLLVSGPFLAVLGGLAWGGLETNERRGVPKWTRAAGSAIVAGLTVAVIAGSLLSLGHMINDPVFARADYRSMAARIAADIHPNAAIVLVAPNQWEAFTYYHRQGAPVYPLPLGRPDPDQLAAELTKITATHDRIYALFWGEDQRDPNRVVERWLDAHTFKATEEWVGDVRFVVYAVADERLLGEVRPSGTRFMGLDGETITLEAWAMGPVVARPGDVVNLRLLWRSETRPERPYKVFIHALTEAGGLAAQRDSEPAGGSRPTTSWAPGELIEDNHGLLLPLDLPAGSYELRLGLYDAFDSTTRLTVDTGDGLSDNMSLGWIIVDK